MVARQLHTFRQELILRSRAIVVVAVVLRAADVTGRCQNIIFSARRAVDFYPVQ